MFGSWIDGQLVRGTKKTFDIGRIPHIISLKVINEAEIQGAVSFLGVLCNINRCLVEH